MDGKTSPAFSGLGKVRISILLLSVLVMLALIGSYYWFSRKKQQPEEVTGTRETVRIGFLPNTPSSLVIIAEAKGFFRQEGLDMILKEYPTGTESRIAMFAKEIDIAVIGDLGITLLSFERKDFSVLATIGSSNNEFKLVSHKDRAKSSNDLKGKRIATAKGRQMHFFLYLFMLKNGLSDKDVEISFKKAEELPLALANGEVDAISTREPIISQARKLLPDKTIVFAEPGLFRATINLVSLKSLLKERPEAIKRVLRALLNAEEFTRKYPEEAMEVVSRKTGVDNSRIASDWTESELKVSLEQSLLLTLEDEARWAIKNKFTDKTEVPNYLNFIYQDGLKAVKPEAVTIIR